jgi:hypothetical protein
MIQGGISNVSLDSKKDSSQTTGFSSDDLLFDWKPLGTIQRQA